MGACEIGVVLVNWHGANDTCDCLLSIKSLLYVGQVRVCVVDNASTDESLPVIYAQLTSLGYTEYGDLKVDVTDSRIAAVKLFKSTESAAHEIIVVSNLKNLGFAAANNIGYALLAVRGDPKYIWFLNNDTEVAPEALSHLVARMEQDRKIGICGATLLHHGLHNCVQAYGGVSYSFATARGHHIGAGTAYSGPFDNTQIEKQVTYISGASMLVSREFLREVGPMCEDYFLYCEEVDWAWRARGRFKLAVETAAVVYHKEGASIGTESQGRPPSLLSDFFQARNRLLFAARYTPWYFPSVWIFLLVRTMKRLVKGQYKNALVMLSAMFGRQRPKSGWFRRA